MAGDVRVGFGGQVGRWGYWRGGGVGAAATRTRIGGPRGLLACTALAGVGAEWGDGIPEWGVMVAGGQAAGPQSDGAWIVDAYAADQPARSGGARRAPSARGAGTTYIY